MDRVAPERIVSAGTGRGIFAFLLSVLFLAAAGCHHGPRGVAPPPPEPEEAAFDNTAPSAVMEWIQPAVPLVEPGQDNAAGPAPEPAPAGVTEEAGGVADDAAAGPPAGLPPAAQEAQGEPAPPPPADAAERGAPSVPAETAPGTARLGDAKAAARKPKAAAAPHPVRPGVAKEARGASLPGWAKGPEELVYRVDFIGITMGYARFRYQGRVSIGGRTAYHLNVRAWTSGVLSFIYPINDTIDYYLDADTLAPIRQEYTQRQKGMPDVAIYDQETGTITYRYLQTGKIRKQVSTVPMVYDPVSVAYYFRWRDLGLEDRPRNVYGGRKVYQISARVLGNERIRTERGEMDTIAVQPLIRRDGKPENKGDLKVWFSGDDRRVPVRRYAKFRKIKDWTLVGELMPKAGG